MVCRPVEYQRPARTDHHHHGLPVASYRSDQFFLDTGKMDIAPAFRLTGHIPGFADTHDYDVRLTRHLNGFVQILP